MPPKRSMESRIHEAEQRTYRLKLQAKVDMVHKLLRKNPHLAEHAYQHLMNLTSIAAGTACPRVDDARLRESVCQVRAP